jgi:hypothetical protein
MYKNTFCYSVFIFKNIYILKTKNLIAKPKKNIEIEFYWGFDDLKKNQDFTQNKQNKVETLL